MEISVNTPNAEALVLGPSDQLVVVIVLAVSLPVKLQHHVCVADKRVHWIGQVRQAPKQQTVLAAPQLRDDNCDHALAEWLQKLQII